MHAVLSPASSRPKVQKMSGDDRQESPPSISVSPQKSFCVRFKALFLSGFEGKGRQGANFLTWRRERLKKKIFFYFISLPISERSPYILTTTISFHLLIYSFLEKKARKGLQQLPQR